MNYDKYTVLRLEWSEVGHIATQALTERTGHPVTCQSVVDDETYWNIKFIGYEMPISEELMILDAMGISKDELQEYQSISRTEMSMEVSQKIIQQALQIESAKVFITPGHLWMVELGRMDEAPYILSLGDLSINLEEIKSKQELVTYLLNNGPNHSTLMDFCEEYRNKYGNELCWPYPISDSKHHGTFIVLVKEGVLSIPYDDVSKENYELFCMDDISFFDLEAIEIFIEDWHYFDKELLQAMFAIKHYLHRMEKQNEEQN